MASLDLGVADFAPSDPTTMPPATSATALAATLGVVLRSETQFTVAGATNPVMSALYFGGTMRAVGGDLTPMLRTGFLGNDASTYWGIEFGGMFRIATLEVVGKATFLTHSGNDVAGLTGLHFVPTIAFRLPFDIVTQTAPKGQPSPSDAQKATAASTPAAAAAPAAPAAPTAPPPAATQ